MEIVHKIDSIKIDMPYNILFSLLLCQTSHQTQLLQMIL
jgi:hypothetical protein